MAAESLPELRKLQRNQFNNVTKQDLIDAILLTVDNAIGFSTQQNEKLDLVVRELAEVKSIVTKSEQESKAQINELKETIRIQSEIIVQHQLFLEQLDRQK